MKRYISLACVALIFVACMAVPVRAVELDNFSMMEVLDYSTSRFFPISSGVNTITFPLPSVLIPRYIDLVVETLVPFTSVSYIYLNGREEFLSFEQIDGNIYRIYGSLKLYQDDTIDLNFTTSSDSWVDFKSVCISMNSLSFYEARLYGQIDYVGDSVEFIKDSSVSTPAYVNIYFNDSFSDSEFFAFLDSPDWKKYDFLDIQLMANLQGISTITAVMGPQNLPIETSIVENTSVGSSYYITIRVDLSGLDRTSSDFPMIIICGNLLFEEYSTLRIMNCSGLIVDDSENFLLYWFSSIRDWFVQVNNSVSSGFDYVGMWISNQSNAIGLWFDELEILIDGFISNQTSILGDFFTLMFDHLNGWILNQTKILESAIRGDTSPGDSFQQEVDEKDQQLNDMAAVMDSVERPELNSVNVSADNYVDSTVLASTMSGITTVIGMPVFMDVIVMSILMATAGYVLFGKR